MAKKGKKKERYWFSAKKFGYGWYPSSWEGWVVLGTYVAVLVVNFIRIDSQSHSVSDTLISWVPETFVLTFFLFYICVKKGEDARALRGK